ncbi:MAG: LysR family transcriptional regulator [Verrucomicrobiota bacterium]
MAFLNYHHLRYFRAIAQEGNLTRAAQHLCISPSALSIQLAQLEESLGQKLFERTKKRLILTEAGHLTLDYAETIFRTGEELFDALKHRAPKQRQTLRIGAVTTLSRNFQLELMRPLLKKKGVELVLRTAALRDLLNMLDAHTIDLILSNLPVPPDSQMGLHSHLISEQEVILVAHRAHKKFRFPDSLDGVDMMLPSLESNIRIGFDLLMSQHSIRPQVSAEVSDMAMLRLLAREIDAITLVPRVVIRDELKNKTLVELHCIDQIRESFYAITPSRHFPNSLVKEIVQPLIHKKSSSKKRTTTSRR